MDPVLAAKAAAGLLAIPLIVLAGRWPWLYQLSAPRFTRLALGLALASRLGLFVLAYWGLGQEVPSDVPIRYLPQAAAALEGGLVYRDFPSSYGPLFSYLVAGIVWVWDSALAIVLTTIALELGAIFVWLAVARRLFSESTARLACLLYLTNVNVLWNVAILGQNQAWLSLAVAGSAWLLVARREALSGFVLGLGVVAVKFLGFLFVPFFWLAARRRLAWQLAFLALPVAAGIWLRTLGADIRLPIAYELGKISSGNLPYLLTGVGVEPHPVWTLAALAALLAIALVRRRDLEGQPRSALVLSVVGFLVFLVLSKKSFPGYQAIFLFPLGLVVASAARGRAALAAFGVFGLVSLVGPSLWYRWLWMEPLDHAWTGGWLPAWQLTIFTLTEVALVGFYLWYAWLGWRLGAGERMSGTSSG